MRPSENLSHPTLRPKSSSQAKPASHHPNRSRPSRDWHRQRPVFDQSLFELCEGWKIVGVLFVDIAPSERAVVGGQHPVAALRQAVTRIGAFERDHLLAAASDRAAA